MIERADRTRTLVRAGGVGVAVLAGLLGGAPGASVLVLLCFASGLALAEIGAAGVWRREPWRAIGPIAPNGVVAIAGYVLGTRAGVA